VAPSTGEVSIHIGDLFEEGGLTHALHSGLPLRIEIVTELWKDGFFDSQKGRADWRASVVYDPLEQRYRVTTGEGGSTEVSVDSLPAVRDVLQNAFTVPLEPHENGRFYYMGTVVVETLSLSDLEELQRWLHGDLAPAVAGEDKVGNAVGRGVRRMLVRMLGLPARRFQVRTTTIGDRGARAGRRSNPVRNATPRPRPGPLSRRTPF
jgi:hypothetical protein